MDMPINVDLTYEYDANLKGLIEQISLNNCCAFIGAGLTKDAGYPLWKDVVNKVKDVAEDAVGHRIEVSLESNCDEIETYRELLGEECYRNELINIFGPDGKHDYLAVHQKICSIPFISWVTTNYDFCLENAAKAASKLVTVHFYPELDITWLRHNHIFHIHGVITPDHPEMLIGSVVLTKRDYDMAYQFNTGLPRFLAGLFENCTIVFIGYSLNDSDLNNVIRTTQLEIERRGKFEFQVGLGVRRKPKHYIIMHRDAKVNEDAIHELGLLPIYFGGETEHYSGLQRLLEYIRMRTTGIVYPNPVINREKFEDGYHG